MSTKNITTTVVKLPQSQVEITVTIPLERVESYRPATLKRLTETLEIDGFRKGHIPESIIQEKLGSLGILSEMADTALNESYPEIITQSGIHPISRPEIKVTKLAPDNDVEFVITTDVLPTITLPKVSAIAKEKNAETVDVTVTDEEIEKAVKEVRQMRAHDKMHEDGVDHHDHNHHNIPDDQLPEIDDAFVQKLGNFTSVDEFMTKLRENMIKEKETHAQEKKRLAIIESIIEQGTFDVPGSMVDFELDRMLEQFKYDLSMSGMKIEEYLGHIGKTITEIRTEWKDQAIKRVQTQLALEKIAEEFSIKPDQEKIDAQVAQILEMYKDQAVEEANVITYVTQILTNTAVFDWLES